MENIFNNPILLKLQTYGQKLGANKFISSLTAGLMSTMAFIMIGAVCQIICSIGVMLNWFAAESVIYEYLYAPYNFTMGLLGLWVTVFAAFNYAKSLNMKLPLVNAIDAGIIFVLVCAPFSDGKIDISLLSSSGMFIGFIVTFFVVRIEKFCIDKNFRIPMPEVCPPSLVSSFAAILPLAVNIILFHGANVLILSISQGSLTLPTAIMAILMVPLGTLTSLPGIFILCFVTLVLWCLGIHGGAITYPIVMASMLEAVQTNAELHAAGQPAVFAPVFLYGAMAAIGGTGNTFPLVLLGIKAKSKQIRAISKANLVPGWFSITESTIFGFPIMYNPILCIPFILNSLVIMGLFALGYHFHIIEPAWTMIFAILPIGLGSYLGTLNIMNAIWDYLMIIPSMLIWYPFLKIYDNQLYSKELELNQKGKNVDKGFAEEDLL